jgi:hypothetical protein
VRPEERGGEKRVDRVVGLFGSRWEKLSTRPARLFLPRDMRAILVRRERPVVLEAFRRAPGQLAFQVEGEILPRLHARRALEVLRREVAPAAPEPCAIRDHHLAMVAQVEASAARRMKRWHEDHDFQASGTQGTKIAAPVEQIPGAIDHQPDLHALARLRRELLADLIGDRIATEDVGADIERSLGGADLLVQRVQRLPAVLVNPEVTE